MYRRSFACRLFFSFFSLAILLPVFSGGNQNVSDSNVPLNNEWVLAVTNLDVSGLSSSRQILGGIVLRSILESLRNVEHRIRGNEEMQYYQDYALSKLESDAARTLTAKQNERDLLVYRGDPGWKYSRNLRTVENDILKLEENYLNVKNQIPVINPKPLVKFPSSSVWPAAPEDGGEYRFCVSQNADAFLSGRITEYYGRNYLTLRLYTLYTRSYSWEDSILFSSEDLDSAVSEISSRLAAVIGGIVPAAIMVHVNPEDAIILVDNTWAGRGETPLRELAPGEVLVSVYSDRHVPSVFPMQLEPGEITELYLNLTPLSLSSFTVDVPGSPESSVFLGSLFLGKTPLYLELPRDQFSYISVETADGETGSVVYRSNSPVRGSAEILNGGSSLEFKTGIPVSPEEKRVANARKNFYSAYGRLWIVLPVSLIAAGIADNYLNAYSYRPTAAMYNPALTSSYVKTGAYVLIGLSAAEIVYRIIRYLGTSGANADPIARFGSNGPED